MNIRPRFRVFRSGENRGRFKVPAQWEMTGNDGRVDESPDSKLPLRRPGQEVAESQVVEWVVRPPTRELELQWRRDGWHEKRQNRKRGNVSFGGVINHG